MKQFLRSFSSLLLNYSRRVAVSYKRKYVHEVLVNCLFKLAQEKVWLGELLWIFYVFVLSCVGYVLCASVYMCFVVTCWERADLLALVCGVFCEFVTFPLVSWVRCGT